MTSLGKSLEYKSGCPGPGSEIPASRASHLTVSLSSSITHSSLHSSTSPSTGADGIQHISVTVEFLPFMVVFGGL